RPSSFGTSLPFWECKGNSFILICKSFFNFFSEALSSTTPSKNQDLLQHVKIPLLFLSPTAIGVAKVEEAFGAASAD
ncbi:MAG TPA: hypothetical protein VIM75_07305, partial [Ohtaekwangia sp.]|uniref:hypothetical protein n=1 Tax=Ohtaekwangia sp. TaxID=2066019 RepID=UPI002F948EE3